MAVFPVLFTAGMTLVDTTDGILMVGAYGWAFMKPIRKPYYNLTIPFVSVIVALMVGGIEAIGLLKDQLSLTGGFWDFTGSPNDNFGTFGFVIIGGRARASASTGADAIALDCPSPRRSMRI
jgi:nickel/cobalt transporter (NiCoT) family protein